MFLKRKACFLRIYTANSNLKLIQLANIPDGEESIKTFLNYLNELESIMETQWKMLLYFRVEIWATYQVDKNIQQHMGIKYSLEFHSGSSSRFHIQYNLQAVSNCYNVQVGSLSEQMCRQGNNVQSYKHFHPQYPHL